MAKLQLQSFTKQKVIFKMNRRKYQSVFNVAVSVLLILLGMATFIGYKDYINTRANLNTESTKLVKAKEKYTKLEPKLDRISSGKFELNDKLTDLKAEYQKIVASIYGNGSNASNLNKAIYQKYLSKSGVKQIKQMAIYKTKGKWKYRATKNLQTDIYFGAYDSQSNIVPITIYTKYLMESQQMVTLINLKYDFSKSAAIDTGITVQTTGSSTKSE